MSALTESEYEAVLREIEGRAALRLGTDADVDWLLGIVHKFKLAGGSLASPPAGSGAPSEAALQAGRAAASALYGKLASRTEIADAAVRAAYLVDGLRGAPKDEP